MLFVCYPKCSTCKKAQKWLDESGAEYTLRDIKTDNPTAEELKAWWEKSGLPLKRFFNTSGNIYKEMKLKDKLPEMSEEEQLALLQATDGKDIYAIYHGLPKWNIRMKSKKKLYKTCTPILFFCIFAVGESF